MTKCEIEAKLRELEKRMGRVEKLSGDHFRKMSGGFDLLWEPLKTDPVVDWVPRKSGMTLFRGDATPVSMEDLYTGQTAFLVLSGPSLKELDTQKLYGRGIVTVGVNNSWSVVKPNMWVCCDTPSNFLSEGWMDPSIQKFVPYPNRSRSIWEKEGEEFKSSKILTRETPNCLFYKRNAKFVARDFLVEETINWGNSKGETDLEGNRSGRSVMLATIRLLYYLGFRRIFLLGCDFQMEEGKENYAFEQERSSSSINGNNRTYEILKSRFKALLPFFNKVGLEIFNCNPNSKLKIFPYKDFDEAIEIVSKGFTSISSTKGWYTAPKDRKKNAGQRGKKLRKTRVGE